jgi:hypothetical protein
VEGWSDGWGGRHASGTKDGDVDWPGSAKLLFGFWGELAVWLVVCFANGLMWVGWDVCGELLCRFEACMFD